MGKPFSLPCSDRGAIMLLRPSHYVFWRRPMSRRTIYFKYCKYAPPRLSQSLNFHSAELEMTVNMLIQIDKLVQLLESPVFTCM